MKVLLSSFYLNGNTSYFYLRTRKARTTLFSVINSTTGKCIYFFRTFSLYQCCDKGSGSVSLLGKGGEELTETFLNSMYRKAYQLPLPSPLRMT